MIFSVTEIMTWMDCRRKHQLQSFNGEALEPLLPKPYFALGTAVHKALERWKLDPQADLNLLYAEVVADTIVARNNLYVERIGAKPSPKEMAPLLENLALGGAMVKNYQEYHKSPLMPGVELISAEQTITVPIPNSTHLLEGTFDALIRLRNKKIAPLDHKTYNTRPNDDMIHRSFQFTGYIWMANQLGMGPCNQLAYDGLWCRDGTKHKLAELFHRELTTRTKHELEEFEENLTIITEEMASENSHKIHHIPWNGCFNCDVKSLCIQMSKGEQIDTTRFAKRDRTRAYSEPES